MNNVWTNVAIIVAILGGTGLVAGAMVMLRPEAERQAPEQVVTRVEVVEVQPEDKPAQVRATGTVEPARQITLMPQVTGRIVWQSDKLVPGNRVDKGTVLARIDPTDYELAVEQSKSQVRAAEVELELEKGRQDVAAKEWALLGDGRDPEDAPLAMRKPQLKAAEQSLAAARAGLRQAELNLQRTFLVAPFNAVVLDESIDLGQVVGPTNTVASLLGTDEVWVKVSVPVDQVPAVALPAGDEPGSPARVEQRLATGSVVRDGSVAQLLAQLDAATRTAQLLVVVPNPMDGPEGSIPLLPGAYVDVAIDGRVLREVMTIPRTALDGGDKVWVVEQEGTLASRTVSVGWREAEDVIVTEGLEAGSRVVVSPLAYPIEGMRVESIPVDAKAANVAPAPREQEN
ncbi:MAG: efflux RND transporter periplasmic adaptor subunit [Myxococcota bacterium]